MEEEMRQGMMGADVQNTPVKPEPTMKLEITEIKVADNLKNLTPQEGQLLVQLNVPEFRNFMSKVFGPEFGMIMEEAIPQNEMPQPQQQVSPQGENPAPTQGQGIMTQPPSQ
tara:strand:+ start:268 stop:603 length:336 start_codon:yes stop_codon:yes gene_type:complete